MDLITCKACGKPVSSNAQSCPSCGEPTPKDSSPIASIGKIIFLLIVLFVAVRPFMDGWSEDRERKKAQAEAAAAGFSSPAEQQKARDAGFYSKAAFDAQEKIKREQAAKDRAAASAKRDAECKQDFECYAKSQSLRAIAACQPLIERKAPYAYEWIDGFWGAKLTHMKRGIGGSIIYSGDQIKVQNEYGAWQQHRYECIYNPSSEKALTATLQPGRI